MSDTNDKTTVAELIKTADFACSHKKEFCMECGYCPECFKRKVFRFLAQQRQSYEQRIKALYYVEMSKVEEERLKELNEEIKEKMRRGILPRT